MKLKTKKQKVKVATGNKIKTKAKLPPKNLNNLSANKSKTLPAKKQKDSAAKPKPNIKMPPAEYKRVALFDEKKPLVLSLEEKSKLKITESKIKQLLDLSHLEELFHILELLNDKQIEKFIEHYNGQKVSNSKDPKIDLILKKSSTKIEILDKLKKQLTDSVQGEYADARREISFLRKKGIDVYVEDLKSMKVPLKIRMFNATSSKKDYYAIKKILEEVNVVLKEKRKEFEKMIEDKEAKAKKSDVGVKSKGDDEKEGNKKDDGKKSDIEVKPREGEKNSGQGSKRGCTKRKESC